MIAGLALSALLDKMTAVNPGLATYTATLHAKIRLTSFPFVQTEIAGTIYRREPNDEKLVVTSGLPAVAHQFANLYPRIVSPAAWPQTFAVTETNENGGSARLHLVPRTRGNVESIDVEVNERTGLIARLRWNYRNGGYAEMTEQYGVIDGDELPVAQQGHIDEPGYTADIDAAVVDYRLNVSLPSGIFAQ